MRLLDLFCGIGGCSLGYATAGFEVVGVDHIRQADYPFEFIKADALGYLRSADLGGFDAIHASPPCKFHTNASSLNPATASRLFNPHADVLTPTRHLLQAAGLPFVLENVPGAPMRPDLVLCGTAFGLEVVRHRWFELGGWSPGSEPPACNECRGAIRDGRAISVFGNGGGRLDGRRGMRGRFADMTVAASFQRALGIRTSLNVRRLSQAIPPAYTEWIGTQLMGHLQESEGVNRGVQAT